MVELFEKFPYMENIRIVIRKMTGSDVSALSEITDNDNVYKFIPPFLYKKNNKFLDTAIKNLGEREFEKKKKIIAGIYLKENPDKLIGLAEMFDFKKKDNEITIGYCINEKNWNQGIATEALKLMVEYLTNTVGISKLQAFVMPKNIYSSKVLLRNGFVKENYSIQVKNWGGCVTAAVDVYTYINKFNNTEV